jgi:hypothetical protein
MRKQPPAAISLEAGAARHAGLALAAAARRILTWPARAYERRLTGRDRAGVCGHVLLRGEAACWLPAEPPAGPQAEGQ